MLDAHGVPKEIYNDCRYVDMGDLPTGFGPYRKLGVSKLFIRPFCVRELSLLTMGANMGEQGVGHILRAVDMAISCDVHILTDGDFEYVMAWLRLNSYPKAPSLVRWNCKRTNVIESIGRAFYTKPDAFSFSARELKVRGLEYEVCNATNNEIVHNVTTQINTFDDDDLEMEYDDLDFPRMSTMVELRTMLADQPELEHHARMARWVKEGLTLRDKMRILEDQEGFDMYSRIQECLKRYKHGIVENMRLRCRTCGNEVDHTSTPNMLTFFANNTEKDILDIQYTLLSELKLQPSDDMPAKTLLYHHSCLAKDKQAEEERRRLQNAVQRR